MPRSARSLVVLAVLGVGARFVGTDDATRSAADLATLAATSSDGPKTLPIELPRCPRDDDARVAPGKLDEYLDLERDGLTAVELDVKDENGEIGFVPSSVPLAVSSGAARDYYSARDVARRARERGVYLIGRIVTFEDPVLSRARPDLAIRSVRRLCVARCGRSRLDESLRPASVEVQRRHRDRGGASRVRRDHVRLRALPFRRRRRERALRQEGLAFEAAGHPGVPSLRATSGSRRTTCGYRRPSSACRRHAISGSASCRGAWRHISTRCTR